ncbi:hypothetical protein [Pseudomonas sp. SLFW]|uniref:hypothetical protein n=1 Tax=Pseudomonas sp. SLFW TaxID=2683259 RepID=UPI00141241E2|nr:hypothetical protein [Pseudomonas sp. SLFW]NBB09564.1 hypothetical protein [Pseudomonas sp. SLFW]
MTHFKFNNRTLQLLSAQATLSGTFHHALRTPVTRRSLPFCLHVDRCMTETQFTVEMNSERHSLTLPTAENSHLKLAAFIEEIANGPRLFEKPTESIHHLAPAAPPAANAA